MTYCLTIVIVQTSAGDGATDCRNGCQDFELRQMNSRLDQVTSYVSMMSSRIHSQDASEAVMKDWRALAKIIDRLMFYVTVLLLILVVLRLVCIA